MSPLVISVMSPVLTSCTAMPGAELPRNAFLQTPDEGRVRLKARSVPSCFIMPRRALAIFSGSSTPSSIGRV